MSNFSAATVLNPSDAELASARFELLQSCRKILFEQKSRVEHVTHALRQIFEESADGDRDWLQQNFSRATSLPRTPFEEGSIEKDLLDLVPRIGRLPIAEDARSSQWLQLTLNLCRELQRQGLVPQDVAAGEALLRYAANVFEAADRKELLARYLLTPSADFYSGIYRFTSYAGLAESQFFNQLPPDSYFVVVDIKGSTQTIETLGPAGYKFVNGAAAAIFQAVRNVNPDLRLPAVYGGDGFNVAVPASAIERTKQALFEAQRMVASSTKYGNLNLRAGAVPYYEILCRGGRIHVAEQVLCSSEILERPVSVGAFTGSGIAIAEHLVKREGLFAVSGDPELKTPDLFKGYECRWNRISSCDPQHHWLSVVIEPRIESDELVRRLLKDISEVLPGFGTRAPFSSKQLALTIDPRELEVETQIHTYDQGKWKRFCYKAEVLLGTLVGRIMRFKNEHLGGRAWKAKNYDPTTYDPLVPGKVDWCKRDGDIKFVWDCTDTESRALVELLTRYQKEGEIYWGSARSSHVTINCIVVDRNRGDDTHLIDGNLTAASKAKKIQKTQEL